jgi:hypothetical protein
VVVDRSRPTRGRKAWQDWKERGGVRGKREIVVALVGAAVSAIILLAIGFPHDALIAGVTIAGSALAAAVIVPAAELYWSWLQAPMRLLTDDVVAIRDRVHSVQIGEGHPKPKLSLRLELITSREVGGELVAEAAKYGEKVRETDAQEWTNSVVSLLAEHSPEDIERFRTAGHGSSNDRMASKLVVLADLIADMEPD